MPRSDGHSEARTEEGRRRLVRHGHLRDHDRHRPGCGSRATGSRPHGPGRRAHPVQLRAPAALCAALEEPRSPDPRPLPQGHLQLAEALAALLGPDAGGLSASTVARLTEVWADEHAHWLKRDLSARHYVYFWADGIHVQARLEDDAQCLLVIIGATPEGKKELVGLIDGVRESAQSWREPT